MPLNRRKFLQQSTVAAGTLVAPRFLTRLSAAAVSASAAPATTEPLASSVTAAPAAIIYPPAPTPIPAPAGYGVASGPFQPSWESLSAYKTPDWFRDAKFGIWAHWGPQCQPEMGDWYAQKMYGSAIDTKTGKPDPDYTFHCEHYGHPSKFGFKDITNVWKAEQWDPEHLISLYKRAGAKYFTSMANHHDNFDMFNSKYQPWNSVAIGPKKDIVNTWKKAAREAGLRFGVTCHGDRAWSWYQAAQGTDPNGPLAGVRYDGLLSKADGKGQWWEGLDPQDYYAQYHPVGKYSWQQTGQPPIDPAFSEKFFNRIVDLIDQTDPDLVYFDDTVLPLFPETDVGLRLAAYLYNTNLAKRGKLDVVMTGKGLNNQQQQCLTLDVERGAQANIGYYPWQTDTCIGSWHYERRLLEQHKYKTASAVAQMLVDIVSKNGNLQLSIPLPGHGMPDEDELQFLADFTGWMDINSDGIFATRPWKIYGEGPSTVTQAGGRFGGVQDVRPYTAKDVRFVQKAGSLYAFMMGWPDDGQLSMVSLAEGGTYAPGKVERVQMLGMTEPLKFIRDSEALKIALPEKAVGKYAYCLKIDGAGLTA
ncbi:MAG TPA: alpha-L-fucosidase [Opitutales bacterium]|jgi:alpha-L-fucosidase|nr:alpha-L-fucosidase [Opitutales bacterium]